MEIQSYNLPKEVIELITKQSTRIKELEDGLRDLIYDVKSKPNDTRYAKALNKANQLLNKTT